MAKVNRKDSKGRVLKEGEYEKSKGLYEFRYRVNKERKSIYASTLTELRVKEKEFFDNLGKEIRTDASKITLNDLFENWSRVKRGIKENTFQNYKYMYTHFVMPDFGKNRITELRKSDFRNFYIHLIEQKGVNISSVDTVQNVLYQILDMAVDDDYIRKNPSSKALTELKKAYNCDSPKERALTLEEQQILENYLKSTNKYVRWYPIFIVMLYTGMRVGEATGLRWQDIDFENNEISINHTLVYFSRGKENGCTFAVNSPKTAAGIRVIPMIPIVKEAFIMEKQYQEDIGISNRAVIDGFSDFVFINRFGDTQHQGTLNKALKRIIRDCNCDIMDSHSSRTGKLVTLPNFSCHALRHTFATRLCEANVNIKVIQNVLGHADIRTTMNIYAEATKDFKHSQIKDFWNDLSELMKIESHKNFTTDCTTGLPLF